MQMFVCEECGCVESLDLVLVADHTKPGTSLLCSACLPVGVSTGGLRAGTGKWHGMFPKAPPSPGDQLCNRPTGIGNGD